MAFDGAQFLCSKILFILTALLLLARSQGFLFFHSPSFTDKRRAPGILFTEGSSAESHRRTLRGREIFGFYCRQMMRFFAASRSSTSDGISSFSFNLFTFFCCTLLPIKVYLNAFLKRASCRDFRPLATFLWLIQELL